MPRPVIALPASVVVGDDAVDRECRLCKKQFSESQNEWFVEKKLEAMPCHCTWIRSLAASTQNLIVPGAGRGEAGRVS